jgi:TonB family protein
LPPHYEQLVIVEITIDVDGSVAQARIVSGSVDPKIQHKLLSAILGFKYSPAKRGGTPIPSQLDLVVHVPS